MHESGKIKTDENKTYNDAVANWIQFFVNISCLIS